MSGRHPAVEFVEAFHVDLSHWFSGTGDRQTVWARLRRGASAHMVLVYPSGRRFTGAGFLESIEDLYGSSPGFVATISDLELIQGDEHYAAVAYVESQTGARRSTPDNRRSALAVVVRDGNHWAWRFIQETALDSDQPA